MGILIVILAGVAVWSLPGLAQSGSMSFSGQMHYPGTKAMTGASYSAERVIEGVRVAPDGTRFPTETLREKVYRDSEGRIRTERLWLRVPAAGAVEFVQIRDPVANVGYVLDIQKKVTHRVVLEMLQPHAGRSLPRPLAIEDLGQQVIESVMAEGHRTTRTWPAGTQGSDRPFQTVAETWYSPEIRELLLSKSTNPTAEYKQKLVHISRGEPDPSLFFPPIDYSVVDETENFEIHWTVPRQ